jgi:hypothetical protein
MSNIIDAIHNLVTNPINHLTDYYIGRNRANNSGDSLEEYVKDLFCNSFNMEQNQRNERLSEVFSYLGNNSNPPDAMLKNGDAIEVKKIESNGSALALNSSYPKHKLYSTSQMISSACKQAENWSEKDMIYVVGVVDKNTNDLKHLCMVYGLDYCASEECYARIKTTIKNGVESIPGVEFAESKELGHINRVDPLGITYMRVRGMWGIDNPWSVFDYVYKRDMSKQFNFMCIINMEKWNTFTNTSLIENLNINGFEIKDVKVKNPDNPAQLRSAKLITYSR